MDAIETIEKSYLKNDIQKFKVGDLIKIHIKISEGGKEKIQPFEGIVIRRRGKGGSETFTVRKISQGIGVERTFLISSPFVDKIKVLKEGKVRRSKLYYLRSEIGRRIKVKKK